MLAAEIPTKLKGSDGKWRITGTYNTFRHMWERCGNTRHVKYSRYGGRGIKVDARWKCYSAFVNDMGLRPDGLSLDRIDNEKGYCKSNCRWATMKEQNNNKSSNRLITFDGLTLNRTQWSERLGFGKDTLRKRLGLGWSVEKALTTPKARGG